MRRDLLFEAFASVIGTSRAAYVCGPLSTGRLYYEAIASGSSATVAEIQANNRSIMHAFAEGLRERRCYSVIDPGVLAIPEWTDADVGEFFIDVIDRFARELWCIPGWEYSRGATKEFQFAVSRGIACRDEQGNIITPAQGRAMIELAVHYVSSLGLDASRLRARVDALGRS
jgi:hypothetical protein